MGLIEILNKLSEDRATPKAYEIHFITTGVKFSLAKRFDDYENHLLAEYLGETIRGLDLEGIEFRFNEV